MTYEEGKLNQDILLTLNAFDHIKIDESHTIMNSITRADYIKKIDIEIEKIKTEELVFRRLHDTTLDPSELACSILDLKQVDKSKARFSFITLKAIHGETIYNKVIDIIKAIS